MKDIAWPELLQPASTSLLCYKYSTLLQPDPALAGLLYLLFYEEVTVTSGDCQAAGGKRSDDRGGPNCKSEVRKELASGPSPLLLSA